MARLIRILLAVVAAVLIIELAIVNRGPVEVQFWPDVSLLPPPATVTMPLFLFAICCMVIGVLVAWVTSWFAGWSSRRRAAQEHRRLEALERHERQRREEEERAELEAERRRRERLALTAEAS